MGKDKKEEKQKPSTISIDIEDFQKILNSITTIASISCKTDNEKSMYDNNVVDLIKREINIMKNKYL